MKRLYVDPAEFLRRLLSPSLQSPDDRLTVGSQVRLKRRSLLLPIIPLDAPGRVIRFDKQMAERGCPYEIEFDLGGYGLSQRDFIPEDLLVDWGIDPNEPLTTLRTYLGPDDLEVTP
ncbi:MAG: hypothetical protein ACYDBJ_20815 [Aggregatilineales bacterium]